MRSVFTGTRYRADHPKILSMGIGRLGQRHTALAGARLTIVFVGAFRIAEYLLKDQATLTSLIGYLATDVVKIGIAAGAGYLAGLMVAGIGVATLGFVSGPLIFSLVVSVGVGASLEKADKEYELTDRLVAQMEVTLESLAVIVQDPAYLACKVQAQVQAQVLSAVDAFIDSLLGQIKQRAQAELRRLIGPSFYPGWHDLPRFF